MYSLLVARGIVYSLCWLLGVSCTLCWLLGGIVYSLLVARGYRVLFVGY